MHLQHFLNFWATATSLPLSKHEPKGYKCPFLLDWAPEKELPKMPSLSVSVLRWSIKPRALKVARGSWGLGIFIFKIASTVLSFSWVSGGRNYHWKPARGQLNVAKRVVVRMFRAYRSIKMIGKHEFMRYENSWDFTFCPEKLKIMFVNKWGMLWLQNWCQELNSCHRE